MNPIDRILAALPGAKRTATGWVAKCPAHDDRRASLSVSTGDDGRALVRCFAGCSAESVCRAIGMTTADLFEPRNGHTATPARPPAKRQTFGSLDDAIASLRTRNGQYSGLWRYSDAGGEIVGAVVRWDGDGGKDIRPLALTPDGWIIGAMPKLRPLFGLPELLATPSGSQIIVVEGESCADAARELGLVATTSAGGSNAARLSDWTPVAGRGVVILPDHDSAGEKYADDVRRLAAAAGARSVRIVRLRDLWSEIPPGGDIADLAHSPDSPLFGCEPAEIRAAIEKLADAAEPCGAIEAESASPAIESFRTFPVESLPERMRQFVEAVAAATGTDPAFAALAALIVTAGCIGNRVAALVKGGWVEPAVLWGVLVGKSGATKSPVLKLATRPIVELFKDARREFAEAMSVYEREAERFKITLDEWRRQQRKGTPTDPPEAPTRPIAKRTIASDTTIEKLGELLESNPLGLLLVRDELAAWVGSFDKYSGGKGSDQPAWLSFYDAATTIIDRKNGGSYFIERAAVSVLGTIQPGTLAKVFGVAERESGLLARILIARPPDRPGLWTDESLPDAVAADWKSLIQSLLAIPPGVDDNGELRPRFITIGREAKPLWVQWHDQHARETVDIGDEAMAAHFAKLKGACIRIALIFTCVEVASGGAAIAHISADAMARAIAVVEWFKHESRRAYSMLGESVEDRASRLLIEWIEKRGGVVTVRDLTHGVRQYRGDPAGAEKALGRLVEGGLASWEDVTTTATGGRPARRIRLIERPPVTKTPANPESFEGFGDGDTGDTSKTDPPESDGDGFAEFEL